MDTAAKSTGRTGGLNRRCVHGCRRWLNGTISGYLWLVFNRKLWRNLVHPLQNGARFFMAFKVFVVSLLQLGVFGVIFIMPSFIGLSGHLAIENAEALIRAWDYWTNPVLTSIILVLYWILYLGSFAALQLHARWFRQYGLEKNAKGVPKGVWNSLWMFRVVLNAIIMVLMITVLVALVAASFFSSTLDALLGREAQHFIRLAFAVAMYYILSPFFLGLLHSWGSFKTMVVSFPSFVLFLPTILCDYFANALANIDNWSWGTKVV